MSNWQIIKIQHRKSPKDTEKDVHRRGVPEGAPPGAEGARENRCKGIRV